MMNGTLESFREALEQEIRKWDGFALALRGRDRVSFDRLVERARSFTVEGSSAGRPYVFETMALSIILSQEKKIRELEETLSAIKSHQPDPPPKKEAKPVEPVVAEKKTLKKPQRSLSEFG